MIESGKQRGITVKAGRELGINERFAQRWWRKYKDSEKYSYKKSVLNNGREKKTLTEEHNQHIRKLIDEDPQIFADNIVDSLTKNFEDFSISKSHLNYLKDKLCLNIKKPTFESADRSSPKSLQR